MIRLTILFMFLPFMAVAQNWPTLHTVVGVSANDTLNVRSAATVTSEVIGQLASEQADIEVVALSSDGNWGQINLGEKSGWVSMRYLSEAAGRQVSQQPIACFGTEPFWSLELGSDGTATYESLTGDTVRLDQVDTQQSENNTTRISVVATAPQSQSGLTGFYRAASCSDGMSDRSFGIAIDFIIGAAPGAQTSLSGCCILAN